MEKDRRIKKWSRIGEGKDVNFEEKYKRMMDNRWCKKINGNEYVERVC